MVFKKLKFKQKNLNGDVNIVKQKIINVFLLNILDKEFINVIQKKTLFNLL